MKKLITIVAILLSLCLFGCASKKQTIIDVTDTHQSSQEVCKAATDKFVADALDAARKDPKVLQADMRFEIQQCGPTTVTGIVHIYTKTVNEADDGTNVTICAYFKVVGILTLDKLELSPQQVYLVGAEECE